MNRFIRGFVFICFVVLLAWPSRSYAIQSGWSTLTAESTSANGVVYEFQFDCPNTFTTGEFYTIPISFTVKSFGTDVVESRVTSILLDISTPSALFRTEKEEADVKLTVVGSGYSTNLLIRVFDQQVGLTEGQARLGWFSPIVTVEERLKTGKISICEVWATVRPTFVSPESQLQIGSLLMKSFTQVSTILAVIAIILSAVALKVSLGKKEVVTSKEQSIIDKNQGNSKVSQ